MTPSPNSIFATAVAAASALCALGMLLAHLRGLRRSEHDAAREEALALAATRAETIRELEARLHALEHAYGLQCRSAGVVVEALRGVKRDLEASPPNLDRAVRQIGELAACEQAGSEHSGVEAPVACEAERRDAAAHTPGDA